MKCIFSQRNTTIYFFDSERVKPLGDWVLHKLVNLLANSVDWDKIAQVTLWRYFAPKRKFQIALIGVSY